MKTFPTAKIRNVALVGHGGAGKTSLAEALLFVAGATTRMGKVEDGSTVSDFDPEEQRRGISVSLTLAPFESDDHKVNLLDAPGYADFVGDVAAALHAADLALFVVSAVEGVEVQTEVAWKLAEQLGVPRAIFVNKLDRERASFSRTLDQLKDRFGAGVAPLQLPIGEEGDLRGVVELLNDSAVTYSEEAPRGTEGAIPSEMEMEEHEIHDSLVEGIVVGDDELMERYLGDEKIEIDELAHALADGIASASVFPVLCGSATRLIGVDRLAKFLVDEAPAPTTNNGQTAVQVFKTIVDPYVGHVNLFKVLGGSVKHDAVLVNARTHADERLHQLFTMRGKEQDAVEEVAAGDIAAVAKLNDLATGDVLATKGATSDIEAFALPEPLLAVAIHAKSKADEDKLANALHRLQEEDPVLRIERDPETHQTLLRGMGETHLSIALERLARKFGVEVESEEVRGRVPRDHRWRSRSRRQGEEAERRSRAVRGCVAARRADRPRLGCRVRRQDRRRCHPPPVHPGGGEGRHRDRGVGGALGFPIVDVRVTCFDGKAHSVDSSEMAFKTAAAHGLKDALAKAGPVLLEPVSELVVTVPEANQGDIMGDLNGKRGRIQGSASVGNGEVEIVATVPTSEVLRYAIDLRSMTGGRGRFTARHSHYDPVPAHLVDKITAGA